MLFKIIHTETTNGLCSSCSNKYYVYLWLQKCEGKHYSRSLLVDGNLSLPFCWLIVRHASLGFLLFIEYASKANKHHVAYHLWLIKLTLSVAVPTLHKIRY